MIRKIDIKDAKIISEIYNYYITNTTVTFEEIPLTAEEMSNRIKKVTSEYPWLIYEEDANVIGYAYATKWKSRCAYRYSVESTIYIHKDYKGKGIGTLLYKKLIEALKEQGIHTIVAGISIPNEASIGLHEKLGFEKVAHFKEVGYKFNTWIDVGYWQYKL